MSQAAQSRGGPGQSRGGGDRPRGRREPEEEVWVQKQFGTKSSIRRNIFSGRNY